ncbi:MAG TPA: hypothetical protein VHI13_18555 [Candidatus Kapabacteria bacterium]|nr:hypothetical protein [Candidatus Kapabacteria bacterium]
MANYRLIHVKLWSDPDIETLPGLARCLFAYLITNQHRNEAALYNLSFARIAFEMGFPVTDIENAMNELVACQKIFRDPATSTVWVKNALRYQSLNGNCIKSIGTDIEHCSSPTLAKQFCEYYKGFGDLGTICQQFLNRWEAITEGFANPPIGIGLGLGEEGGVGGEEITEAAQQQSKSRPRDVDAVKTLFRERSYPNPDVEAEKFWDYYTSNGWKVGKNAMRDWKAAAANWARNVDSHNGSSYANRGRNGSGGNEFPHGYHGMSELEPAKQHDPQLMEKIAMCKHADGRQYWVYRIEQRPVLDGFQQLYPRT